MLEKPFYSLSNFFGRLAGAYRSQVTPYNYQYLVDQPAWLILTNASDFRKAVAENPVLYGCIDILASAAANGKKYLVDLDGNEIPWNDKRPAVQNARKLFCERPNPLQSAKEFNYERAYMFFTFGNNYVYLNNPLETIKTDILNVRTMINLPSEWVVPRQTGKIYDQIELVGIIEKYVLTNLQPAKEFLPDKIIHFNDLNTSEVGNSIIGTSRLQALKYPITNTQLAFEAMNVILKSRGMQGIISANNKDATGTQIPMSPLAKSEIDKTFRKDYGLRQDQKTFLITYSDITYTKTIMNSQELGIYDEFSNNAMILSNGLGVPAELYKTYQKNATFENQIQSVRRLYQDTIIPKVENEDQYFTERLRMRDYGFEIRTDFSHVPALAENQKDKAISLNMNVRSADVAYNQNLITVNQYLEMIDLEGIEAEGEVYKFDWDKTHSIAPVATLTPVVDVQNAAS